MKKASFVFALAILFTRSTPISSQTAPLTSLAIAQATNLSTSSPFPASFSVTTYTEPPPSPPFTAAKIGSSDKNLTYCITGGTELKLDIFYPTVQSAQKYPLVVWIHGGGLAAGSAKEGVTDPRGSMNVSDYSARGYALASINYRPGPDNQLPTMIEDAKCAIRFLRARAASYNINPDRIGVVGPSFGGYLAAMLGLTDASAGFEGLGAFPGVSSRVQAVVAEFPVVSFELPSFNDRETDSRKAFVPAGANARFLHSISLPTYISPDDPPFLFFHGEFDAYLSPGYTLDLNSRLIAAGVDSTYVLVKRAGHGWQEMPPDKRLPNTPWGPEPSKQAVLKQELDFFDKHLKRL